MRGKKDFLKLENSTLALNPSHKYYTQLQGHMALVGCLHGYFVVWTSNGPPFIQKMFDPNFRKTVMENLVFFFKGYLVKVLLNIETITYCQSVTNLA